MSVENKTKSGTKTIAINTIVVYARLLITTVIGLITSRYVLQVLGVSDYGLYNVVGGVIALFSVVSGSLSTTTIRFLNIEIGKKDGDPNRLFNICNVIHIVFAIILLVAAESVGFWYINNYLNVDPGKETDAMFVFHVSTIVACLGLINIPYMSTFIAKEKFLQIAVIDITNSVVKLGSVLLLFLYSGNILRAYALLMSLTTIIPFVAYHVMSYWQWGELVRWKFVPNKSEYKKVLAYNNYNILATLSLVVRSQGSNMLINFFFGTLVNGAYAIARTVQGFVEAFMSNFDAAAAPRIIQNVGAGDKEGSEHIVNVISRYCVLMMILVFFPLMVETEFILKLWLGQVPEHVVDFSRLLLIVVLVASTAGGILQYINASDKIKWFKIQSCFWSVIVLPVGYFIFKCGYDAWWIFALFIISDVFNRIFQLYLMNKLLGFDSLKFVKEAYVGPIVTVVLMTIYISLYQQLQITGFVLQLVGIIVTLFVTVICVCFVGLKQHERNRIVKIIKYKIK